MIPVELDVLESTPMETFIVHREGKTNRTKLVIVSLTWQGTLTPTMTMGQSLSCRNVLLYK